MTLTININGLTLCHRGSDGITHNTIPDVCKTPDKGIPLPYQNEAYSRDLVAGTFSVFADGGNMIANYGSNFCKSIYDEEGSMGGIFSGTHLAEADWITHSFDVFFEKKAACRLTDKMFHNHRNTVNLAGLTQEMLAALRKELQDFICDCDKEIKPGPKDTCMSLGAKKHDCVEKKKENANKKRVAEGKKPNHGGEKGYKLDKDGNLERENGKPKVDDIAGRRAQKAENVSKASAAYEKAQTAAKAAGDKLSAAMEKVSNTRAAAAGRGFAYKALKAYNIFAIADIVKDVVYTSPEEIALLEQGDARRAAEQASKAATAAEQDLAKANAESTMRRKGYKYPDGSILDEDGKIREISEYKFKCKDIPGRKSKGKARPSQYSSGQKENHERIAEGLRGEEATKDVDTKLYSNDDCE